jgi:hypothetical protein
MKNRTFFLPWLMADRGLMNVGVAGATGIEGFGRGKEKEEESEGTQGRGHHRWSWTTTARVRPAAGGQRRPARLHAAATLRWTSATGRVLAEHGASSRISW